MRILYIKANVVPPPADPAADRFYLLSEVLEGDVLQPVWYSTPQQIEERFGPGSYPAYTVGRFRYHWFLIGDIPPGPRQRLAVFRFYVRKARELFRERRFDCVVVYSHMTTGLIGLLLKVLSRTPMVVEIVTDPSRIYLTHEPNPGWKGRLKHWYSNLCLHLSAGFADHVHLLYPNQLAPYPLLRNRPKTVFPDMVPVSTIQKRDYAAEAPECFVVMAGAPWYLKGADLLVQSFIRVAPEFPAVKLKIFGHYPDGEPLKRMAAACPQIEISKAVHHTELLEIVSRASVMVLMSRCEGVPHILMEGMAAGLPVIGSDVAGIPYLIRHGENGFVAPAGDLEALAGHLRRLLADQQLCRQMGEKSYQRVRADFSEREYVRNFKRMVEAAASLQEPR
jgi:glycosyltransferase involved in cell wall biosynthesis